MRGTCTENGRPCSGTAYQCRIKKDENEKHEERNFVLPPLLQRVLGPVHRVHVRQLLPLLHLVQRSFVS